MLLAQFGHSHPTASGNGGNPPEPQVPDPVKGSLSSSLSDGSEAVLELQSVRPHTSRSRLLSSRHTGSCEPAAPHPWGDCLCGQQAAPGSRLY